MYYVTVECISPKDNDRHVYVLTTKSSKARRYQDMEQTEVYYLPNEDEPLLPEEMHYANCDSVLGLIPGILFGGFTLFVILEILLVVADFYRS